MNGEYETSDLNGTGEQRVEAVKPNHFANRALVIHSTCSYTLRLLGNSGHGVRGSDGAFEHDIALLCACLSGYLPLALPLVNFELPPI